MWQCDHCNVMLPEAPGNRRCPDCKRTMPIAEAAKEQLTIAGPGMPPVVVSFRARPGATSRDSLISDVDVQPPPPATMKVRRLTQGSAEVMPDADYEVLEVLGEVAMGEVVAARQVALDRIVAIKRLPDSASITREFLRLQSEALITASLGHPNIIPIHDLGVDQDGRPFFAMKKIKGRLWSDCFRIFSEYENQEILLKVCDAVAFAHAQQIIHRDLKPENIMIGDFGEVLVMDWGLAVRVADIQGRPSGRSVCGTPAYMAPEMARADNAAIGIRSDIYLLGAILFELVIGNAPHPGDDARDCLEMAARNLTVPFGRDDECADIVRRAMNTDPAMRFQEVREFQAALRAVHQHNESNLLCESGRLSLAEARRSGRHDLYARAIASYDQALVLWRDNVRAAAASRETRRALADHALQTGDLQLAGSLIVSMHDAVPGSVDDLRQRLGYANRHRHAARRLNRWLIGVTTLAVGGGLLVSTAAAVQARAEKEALVAAIRERDSAELHLAAMEHRAWSAVIAEDFTGNRLPAAIHALKGLWALDNNRLVATGPTPALAELASPGSGSLRVSFDLVNQRAVAVMFAVDRGDLPDHPERSQLTIHFADGVCTITRGDLTPIDAPIPTANPNLARHVLLERDNHLVRVLVDGKLVMSTMDVAGKEDPLRSRLAISAVSGASFGNLESKTISSRTGAAVLNS